MKITSAKVTESRGGYRHLVVDFSDIRGTAFISTEAHLHLETRGWEAVFTGLENVPELTVQTTNGPKVLRGFTDDPEVVKLAREFIADPGLPLGPVDLDALGVAHE